MNGPVSTWRDSVSESLGGIKVSIKNIDKKLDHMCSVQTKHDSRIDKLEITESNRSAVQKRMNAVIALIVAVVTTLANIAWKIVK